MHDFTVIAVFLLGDGCWENKFPAGTINRQALTALAGTINIQALTALWLSLRIFDKQMYNPEKPLRFSYKTLSINRVLFSKKPSVSMRNWRIISAYQLDFTLDQKICESPMKTGRHIIKGRCSSLCAHKRIFFLPWLPPRVASWKASLRVSPVSFTLLIWRLLDATIVFLIASSIEAEYPPATSRRDQSLRNKLWI